MQSIRWLILFLLVFVSGAARAVPQDADIPACPSTGQLCRVTQTWTLERLRSAVGRLQPGEGKFITDDSQVTFVYRASSSHTTGIGVLFTIGDAQEIPMQAVADSDLWVLDFKLQFERYDRAILTIGLVEHSDNGNGFQFPFMTYRGPNAPAAPRANTVLQGIELQVPLVSASLKRPRDVFVYLPPGYDEAQTYPVIYMSDGEGLPAFAPLLDHLITRGDVPPTVMIGTASAQGSDRGSEYVPGRSPAAFQRHEKFFTEEVPTWAEGMFSISTDREDTTLFGISNGGLFAVSMSVRHPDLYGNIFAFSAGASAGDGGVTVSKDVIQLPLNVYTTAGTLEPVFHTTTRGFVRAYNAAGAYAEFSEEVSGHDDAMWQVEFVNALLWLDARKSASDSE